MSINTKKRSANADAVVYREVEVSLEDFRTEDIAEYLRQQGYRVTFNAAPDPLIPDAERVYYAIQRNEERALDMAKEIIAEMIGRIA